ncbi:MAG: hypothetical protein PHT03_03175 [Bacilli bacterium]|nr:hypothetical protein [Bacilli bacterium]MDD4388972.1 hypothetical protein [Bacilli bacterium]
MARKKIETIICEKIAPFTLNEKGKADISQTTRKYPYELLVECIDIGVASYFRYDDEGHPTKDSVENFVNKLGGIAFNKSRAPLEQEVSHQKNKCKGLFSYWNSSKADNIFCDYIQALRNAGWSDNQILQDLQTEVNRLSNNSSNWSQWSETMLNWIEDIKHWNDKDTVTIEQQGTIIPEPLFDGLSPNIKSLCRQINASYENNLFDCTAVIMRRLLEGLLVLSYQNMDIEAEITDKNSKRHATLDKIIKNAEQNSTLSLSTNTRNDMALFKDLGNYSAHKIWYNSTQKDIAPHILKYRVIIEELIYKAGLK